MPDGRIGLIDYGQNKRLTQQQRKGFAELLLAVCTDDPKLIADKVRALGLVTEKDDENVMYQLCRVMYGVDSWETRDGMVFTLLTFISHECSYYYF